MLIFGNADLTPWVSRVDIQEEYDATKLEPFNDIGLLVGHHQPREWRINAQGYAFGDDVNQLRAVLTLAKQQGVQPLRFAPDRVIPAYLERFQVSEWDGALLIPNVRLHFIGIGYATDTTPQQVDWDGASNTTYYARSTVMTNAGQYEAPLRFSITLTYPHDVQSGDNDLELTLRVSNYPREIIHRLRFWVRDQTAPGTVVVDSGVQRYEVSYPAWYRLMESTSSSLPRIPTQPGNWDIHLVAKAFNNGLLQFSVASSSVQKLNRYANW